MLKGSMLLTAALMSLDALHAQASVIFEDGTFSDSDWTSSEHVENGLNGTFVAAQQASGGNPGANWRVQHNIIAGGGTGFYALLHSRSDFTYDPALMGPIGTIDFSLDSKMATNGTQAFRLALEQGGNVYVNTPRGLAAGNWETFSETRLRASDFGEFSPTDGDQDFSSNPDFSAAGGLITLGFTTRNSTSNDITRTVDYDNFRVHIQPVPLPPAVLLLGSALAGLAVFSIKGRGPLREIS